MVACRACKKNDDAEVSPQDIWIVQVIRDQVIYSKGINDPEEAYRSEILTVK
jgi:hypothetical protein